MINPPALNSFNTSFRCDSTIGTAVNKTLLSAPGPAYRYRIWGLTIGSGAPIESTPGNAAWRCALRVLSGKIFLWYNGYAGESKTEWIPGGIPFQTNEAVVIEVVANVVSLSLRATIFYEKEFVAAT